MTAVTFEGQDFELKSGPLNELVMTEFYAATADVDPDSQIAPGVMLALLEECVAEKDWARFRRLGRKTEGFWEKATVVLDARMRSAGEHPTGLPSDSTDGQSTTLPTSEPNSDAKVTELFPGRPDMALAVRRAKAV